MANRSRIFSVFFFGWMKSCCINERKLLRTTKILHCDAFAAKVKSCLCVEWQRKMKLNKAKCEWEPKNKKKGVKRNLWGFVSGAVYSLMGLRGLCKGTSF